jgi:hypothetical protein
MAQAPQAEVSDERARIERVLAREGPERAREWAQRTEVIYRRAVLDHEHFAHTPEYRRRFIESYLELKRFALEAHKRDRATPN